MLDLKTKQRIRKRLQRRRKARKLRAKGPNPLRIDPTKTATLRREFMAALKKRFSRLKFKLHQLIVVEDALGLRASDGSFASLMTPPERERLSIINAFCPTGEGGGIDNSCPPGGGGKVSWDSVKIPSHDSWKDLPAEKGYVYHATNLDNAVDISIGELEPHGPDYGTDQGEWPDGSTQDRSYFSDKPSTAWMFAPEHGKPVLLRVARNVSNFKKESTGDIYTRKTIKPVDLELLTEDGWKHLSEFRHRTDNTRWKFQSKPEQVKAFQAWLRAQVKIELLGKDDEEVWRRYVEEGFRRGAGRSFDDVNSARKRNRFGPREGDFYRGSKQQFLRDSFAQPVAVEKVKLLAGRTLDDLEGVTQQMSMVMVRDLTNGLVMGQSPEQIAETLSADVETIGSTRALTIARTEIIRAHAEGQLQALEMMGVEEVGVAVEWTTAGDEKVCPACAPMEGVVLKLAEAHNLIPRHPNCVVGETVIEAPDSVAIMSAEYTGTIVELTVANGRKLAVTVNHIVLTQRGWVFAKDITDRDYLVDTSWISSSSLAPYDDHRQSNIRKVFESAIKVLNKSRVSKSLAMPEDLHGDGVSVESEIQIVSTDGVLWNELDSTPQAQTVKSFLFDRNIAAVQSQRLKSKSLLSELLERAASAADCLVRSLGVTDILLARSLGHHKPVGVGVGSDLMAEGLDNSANGSSLQFELQSESVNAAPAQELLDDLVRGKLVKVERCTTRHVERLQVYDVNTKSSAYAANGVITSNCRCAFIPANVGEDDGDQKTTAKEVRRALRESAEEGNDDEDFGEWGGLDVEVSTARPRSTIFNRLQSVANAFCPTGEGGGQDNSCSSRGGKNSIDKEVAARLREYEYQPESVQGFALEGTDYLEVRVNPGAETIRKMMKESKLGLKGISDLRTGQVYVWSDDTVQAHHQFVAVQLLHLRADKLGTFSIVNSNGGMQGNSWGDKDYPANRFAREIMKILGVKEPTNNQWVPLANVFCPTGEGGGIDNTCPPGGSKSGISVDYGSGEDGSTDRFKGLVERAIASLPAKFVGKLGVKIRVKRLPAEEEQRRGVTRFTGAYSDKSGEVTLIESAMRSLSQEDVTHTIAHELAHEWEKAAGIEASDEEYMWARISDVSKFSKEDKGRWSYVAEHSPEPLVEAIAQAINPAQRTAWGIPADEFKRAFPKVNDYVHKKMAGWDLVDNWWAPVKNAFCPTGEGGGIDNSCPPSTVFHGTESEFTKFDLDKTRLSPRGSSGGLGAFFAYSREEARHYGKRVIEARLRLKKVAVLSEDDYRKATNSKADARQLKADLIGRGYDGAHIPHLREYVVLDPDRIDIVGETRNVFCPTGEGGGIDPTCSPGGASKIEPLPKGVWKKVSPGMPEFERYRSQLYRLIQTAYAEIGGHIKIKDESSLDRYKYWLVNDMDDDPEIDVVIFGKGEFGVKSAGVGHDGSEGAVKMYKNEAARLKRGEDPTSPHWWGEASGKAAYMLMSRAVPAVEDEKKVAKLLGKDQWKWLGDHPDPEAPELFKKYHGWYEKDFGGGHKHVKIILGIPDLSEPPQATTKNEWRPIRNAFCPTGEGGGIDNSCPPGGWIGTRSKPPTNAVEARDRFNEVSQRLFGKHGEEAGIFTVHLDGGRTITAHLKVPMEIRDDKVVHHYRVRVDFGVEGRTATSVGRKVEKESLAVIHKVKEAVRAYHAAGFELEVDPADSRRREYYGRVLKKMGLRHEGGDYAEVWNVFCPNGPGGGIDPTCSPGGVATKPAGGASQDLEDEADYLTKEDTHADRQYSERLKSIVLFKEPATEHVVNKFIADYLPSGTTIDDLVLAAGCQPGSVVKVEHRIKFGSPVVTIRHYNEAAGIEYATRKLEVDGRGGLHIHNDVIEVSEDKRGSGIGLKIFSQQVEEGKRLGAKTIKCHAAGSYDPTGREMNGYATWPLLGYNGAVSDLERSVRLKVRDTFPQATTVLDVIETPEVTIYSASDAREIRTKMADLDERLGRPVKDRQVITGRDWWTVHGRDIFDAEFNLDDGSRSWEVLNRYRAAKSKSKGGR